MPSEISKGVEGHCVLTEIMLNLKFPVAILISFEG